MDAKLSYEVLLCGYMFSCHRFIMSLSFVVFGTKRQVYDNDFNKDLVKIDLSI